MKEYRLYRSANGKEINKQVHYNPHGDNIPYYATVEEAIELNKVSLRVTAEGSHSAVLLDFSDERERKDKI